MTNAWEPIFTVSASNDPAQRGSVYLLSLPDGRTFELGDADDRYSELAQIIDSAFEETEGHPEHEECADGCGLAVTHVDACLDKPGGRQVCEHEEPDGAPVEQWEVTTPADVYLREEDL